MGTKPDACVLVVNDIDRPDYIEATIAGSDVWDRPR
jgi:hypothetical protein